jgi:hypothetical protein
MKKSKLAIIISVAAILVIALSTAAFAIAQGDTPAEIVAGLTGKTVDEVNDLREDGQTYGEQAKAAGKLDEFQEERLALTERNLDQAVLDKEITQEEADALLAQAELRIQDCDGTGSGEGQGNGLCDGTGSGGLGMGGQGNGACDGTGSGAGKGAGQGQRSGNGGNCDGSCVG